MLRTKEVLAFYLRLSSKFKRTKDLSHLSRKPYPSPLKWPRVLTLLMTANPGWRTTWIRNKCCRTP